MEEKKSDDMPSTQISAKFSVRYMGTMTMNRLYSQTMQPWVMAEIRRKKKDGMREVNLEIWDDILHVLPSDVNGEFGKTSPPLLEHHLAGLTRFAKLHQDPCCFAYLTRYQLNADFECHVFLANNEDIIRHLFRAIRDASKDINTKPTVPVSTTSAPTSAPCVTSSTVTTALGNECVPSVATTATSTATSVTATSAASLPPSESNENKQPDMPCSPSPGNMGESGLESKDPTDTLFEVKYMGRAKVAGKRVTAEYIDNLAEKILAREEEAMLKKMEADDTRKRHASDASVKSLPDTLDDESVNVTENKLVEQKQKMNEKDLRATVLKRGMATSQDGSGDDMSSNGGSLDNLNNSLMKDDPLKEKLPAAFVEFKSDSDGSRDTLDSTSQTAEYQTQSYFSSGGSPQDMGRRRHASALAALPAGKRSESLAAGAKMPLQDDPPIQERPRRSSRDMTDGSNPLLYENSRIMVLQISHEDIALISLDKKAPVLTKPFKDISFVSQGAHKQDLFGIVAREPGSSFICYVMKCHAESVVMEIMSTLQLSFSAAFKRRGSSGNVAPPASVTASPPASSGAATTTQHQVCTMCPLYQLHRVSEEIHALSPQATHDYLLRKIHSLPEKEYQEIVNHVQMEAPKSFEESVEVMMICLRHLCERKQKVHAHLSEGHRTGKSDVNLFEEKHKLFEGLRNKAKKSLTTSFENILGLKDKKLYFVKEGTKTAITIESNLRREGLLGNTDDWVISADLPEQRDYPFEIKDIRQRPDVVLHSQRLRKFIFIELTVPYETNMEEQHTCKLAKYEGLVHQLSEKGIVEELIAVEVGSRDFLQIPKENQIESWIRQHKGAGIQHIAFNTPDIKATVKHLKAYGALFAKAPPPAYYSEVGRLHDIRNVGEDENLLCEHGILIDTEADGAYQIDCLNQKGQTENQKDVKGERYLLQIFTQPVFKSDPFFMEFIQREGATGFGSGNVAALYRSVQAYIVGRERH